jgi:hypothetical protein
MAITREIRIRKLFFAILIAACFSSCTLLSDKEQQESEYIKNQYYYLESQTILNSLEENSEYIFTELSPTPDMSQVVLGLPVTWKQEDYVKIADAIIDQNSENEDIKWALRTVTFSLSCSEVSYGVQSALFLFSTYTGEGNQSRIDRYININPQQSFVNVWGLKYTPAEINSKNIDINAINITAEKALQIAETHGGKKSRGIANNDCEINISLVIIKADPIWQVSYQNSINPNIFYMYIDSETGKYEVIK